jgi:ribose-phosphate pyrophosphokinase
VWISVIVVPGPSSLELGRKTAEFLKAKVVSVGFKTFPDGESYIRLEGNVEGEDVAIVQTTSSPQDSHIIQLFLMADAARDLGAKEVVAVVPYFAYARQDKRALSGEAFSVKTMVTLLGACGVSKIITVNSHNPEVLKSFRVPIKDLSAISLIADYFKNRGYEGAFSLLLGKKAVCMATEANNVLKGGYDCVATERDKVTGEVKIVRKPLQVKNRDVIIFDDIISSGGTMAKAVKAVKDQGARKVYAACVHPILAEGSEERIVESGAEGIIATDCVPSIVSVVSVAPLIAQALSKGV